MNTDIDRLPAGTVVRIRVYEKNPGFWDDDYHMYNMMGEEHVVSEYTGSDCYKLEDYNWSWRRTDLIVVNTLPNSDPNVLFKLRRKK